MYLLLKGSESRRVRTDNPEVLSRLVAEGWLLVSLATGHWATAVDKRSGLPDWKQPSIEVLR